MELRGERMRPASPLAAKQRTNGCGARLRWRPFRINGGVANYFDSLQIA